MKEGPDYCADSEYETACIQTEKRKDRPDPPKDQDTRRKCGKNKATIEKEEALGNLDLYTAPLLLVHQNRRGLCYYIPTMSPLKFRRWVVRY